MFASRLATGVTCCAVVVGCGGSPTGQSVASSIPSSAGWTTYPAVVDPGWEFAELRTNGLNDGSMFEPCTAYTPAELRSVGLAVAEEARNRPVVEEEHERGCLWDLLDVDRAWVTQGTVNYGEYRDDVETIYQREYATELTFFPNEFRHGRIVATWRSALNHRCTSEFEVEGAILVTAGADDEKKTQTVAQMCERIRPFVDLALSKALPP